MTGEHSYMTNLNGKMKQKTLGQSTSSSRKKKKNDIQHTGKISEIFAFSLNIYLNILPFRRNKVKTA